jgi:hypothetical protein
LQVAQSVIVEQVVQVVAAKVLLAHLSVGARQEVGDDTSDVSHHTHPAALQAEQLNDLGQVILLSAQLVVVF